MAFLRNIINHLKNNYAFFAKYITMIGLYKKNKEKWILVYTMGKVGSSTVVSTLNKIMCKYSIFHIHWLSKKNILIDIKFHKKFFYINKKKGLKSKILPKYIIEGIFVNNYLRGNNEKKIKVYSLVRDPLLRNISAFFENVKLFFGYDIKRKMQMHNEKVVIDELSSIFTNEFIGKNKRSFLDGDPLTWFDEELKQVFALDVYNSVFPKEKGYKIYNCNGIDFLLIRLEDLDRCFTDATEKFLGKKISLAKEKNVGANKVYASIYTNFKKNVEIPDWYVDEIYDSKFAKHFYTEKEIIKFKGRWLKSS